MAAWARNHQHFPDRDRPPMTHLVEAVLPPLLFLFLFLPLLRPPKAPWISCCASPGRTRNAVPDFHQEGASYVQAGG